MKVFVGRIFVTIVFLIFCGVTGLYFRRDKSGLRSAVEIETVTYYALESKSGEKIFFSELSLMDRATKREEDRVFLRNCALTSDSAKLRMLYVGLRVNREAEVQVALPSMTDTLRGSAFEEVVERSLLRMKEELNVLKGQLKEMRYYERTHSVVDDGYNDVMAFAIRTQKDFMQKQQVYEGLRKHFEAGNLMAVKQADFLVNGSPYRLKKQENGLAVLQARDRTLREVNLGSGVLQEALLSHPSDLPYPRWKGDADCASNAHKFVFPFSKQETKDRVKFLDSLGTFFCMTLHDSLLHGTATAVDGTFYRGYFDETYRRHGFGFAVDQEMVKCGIWKHGRFQGERMVYTPDRIYGIDISRYQHEIGKKKYPIRWEQLRIRDLGILSDKKIHGKVDYPVSFVFIKATEGKSIRNRYYDADLKAALRHGFPTAPYHFFSTKSDGAIQARFFLRHARHRAATLPPMLDVEPSDAQIKQMGGVEVLFREVLEWLQIVERATGRRPLLYVSQTFVNTHMEHAPEALKRYEVWIARYGEFKPYVKLLLWQLSPDGRVNGFRGDVDINVFNGTKEEFERWASSSGASTP